MARFGRGKKFETTDIFPTIPVQKIVETMAKFGGGKKFKTTDGLQTIPVSSYRVGGSRPVLKQN